MKKAERQKLIQGFNKNFSALQEEIESVIRAKPDWQLRQMVMINKLFIEHCQIFKKMLNL